MVRPQGILLKHGIQITLYRKFLGFSALWVNCSDAEEIGIGVKPLAGMMLIWNNIMPSGTLNYQILHTGTPAVKDMKHIITKW
jgi:hypothetical protein